MPAGGVAVEDGCGRVEGVGCGEGWGIGRDSDGGKYLGRLKGEFCGERQVFCCADEERAGLDEKGVFELCLNWLIHWMSS